MAEPVTHLDALEVADDQAGVRLDIFLARRLGLSRRQVRRLLADGLVMLDGRRLNPRDAGRKLEPTQRIKVTPFQRPEQQVVIPKDNSEVRTIAAGDDWAVVDKPAHMPVHPLKPDETDTVLNVIAARFPGAGVQGVGEGGLRSGVVHRLDVTTSGTLLIALTPSRWDSLRRAFAEHRVEKRYLAIVHGELEGERREQMHLIVAQHRPAKVRVVDAPEPRSRLCSLSWRAVRHLDDATLLEVDLHTGFLHQVRVMLAHLGHPILGDAQYGDTERPTNAERPMLHAASLRIDDIAAACDPPADFQHMIP